MEYLFRPVARSWTWVEHHWGYPGQIFVVLMVAFCILGVFYFVGNRRS